VPIVRDKRFRKTMINSFEAHFGVLTFVNPNTRHLICNNFNLNFIIGIVCLFVCVCAFSLRRESPDMILGDKPLIFEVVLSHIFCSKVLRRRAKSSMSSPGLKAKFSHSLRSAYNVVLRVRSLPMRATAMASHTSLSVCFLQSENYISGVTVAMRASSTRRSS
jgi:hypothetical protein